MPDYGNGKIYTIRCKTDDTLIYVGSTIQSLAVRWGGHKKDSIKEKDKNRLIYMTINDDWDNWYYELYELYPCSCKDELCRKEGEIIRLIGTLNDRMAGQTGKEWYEANKGKRSEQIKEYQKNNKEKIADQKKNWYEANKEKRKAYMKEYRLRKKLEKQHQQ
jgi:hypothetical protein